MRELRVLLAVTMLAATVASEPITAEGPAFPSPAEIAELDKEAARMAPELVPAEKAGGPIECTDNSCIGTYQDLVQSIWEDYRGHINLYVKPEVKPFLSASSHGCLYDHYIVLKPYWETSASREATAHRWQASLATAQALGHNIKINWQQSNYSGWPVCMVSHIGPWE